MQINKKHVEQFLTFAVLPISIVWMIFEPGFEPLIGIVTGSIGPVSWFFPVGSSRKQSEQLKGRIEFDYSTKNGRCRIGSEENRFETHWTRASDDSIHITKDPPSIIGMAKAEGIYEFNKIHNAEKYDFSSSNITVAEGEIVLLKNQRGNYTAIRIVDVEDSSRHDARDLVTFEYRINSEAVTSFAILDETSIWSPSGRDSFPWIKSIVASIVAATIFSLGTFYLRQKTASEPEFTLESTKNIKNEIPNNIITLKILASAASSIKINEGCVRFGGSLQTSTDISEIICTSQEHIDAFYADSVKYIVTNGCAKAILYEDAEYKGRSESISSCE